MLNLRNKLGKCRNRVCLFDWTCLFFFFFHWPFWFLSKKIQEMSINPYQTFSLFFWQKLGTQKKRKMFEPHHKAAWKVLVFYFGVEVWTSRFVKVNTRQSRGCILTKWTWQTRKSNKNCQLDKIMEQTVIRRSDLQCIPETTVEPHMGTREAGWHYMITDQLT